MFQPLYDYVIVREPQKTNATASGIILPDIVNEAPNTYVVVAVGPGGVLPDGSRLTPTVKEGDKILANPRGMGVHPIQPNAGEQPEFFWLRETDVVAVLE